MREWDRGAVTALHAAGYINDASIVEVIRDRLAIAISGKGAFRRFKDVLSRWPEELPRYFLLRDDRQRGRTRAWLAAKGYRPAGAAGPRPA
jgi:hypothetical protein